MTMEVINYDVKEATLALMRTTQETLLAEDSRNMDAIKKEKKAVVKLRTGIEKRRKEYNKVAREYIKNVDNEAKSLQEKIAEIETLYIQVIEEYDAEQHRLAALAEKEEADRVAAILARINTIGRYKNPVGRTAAEITEAINFLTTFSQEHFNYEEFTETYNSEIEQTISILKEALDRRVAFEFEQAAIIKQREIDEANRKAFEDERRTFEAEKAALAKERAALEAARLALEAPKPEVATTPITAFDAATGEVQQFDVAPEPEQAESWKDNFVAVVEKSNAEVEAPVIITNHPPKPEPIPAEILLDDSIPDFSGRAQPVPSGNELLDIMRQIKDLVVFKPRVNRLDNLIIIEKLADRALVILGEK